MIFVSIVKLIVKVGNAINFPVKKLYTYVVKTQTKKTVITILVMKTLSDSKTAAAAASVS